MKDITSVIKNAASEDVLWSIDIFFLTIKQLESTNFQVSFWKNEEDWASILSDKKIIGYLWKRYPLALVTKEFIFDIKNALSEYNFIYFIEVENLANNELKIRYEELKDVLNFGLDYENFSADDFWFYNQ